jgi:hypothetical protein
MDLGLLMSDSPERNTKINLFHARINIFVSYNLVIFIAGRQHEGRIFDLRGVFCMDLSLLMSDSPEGYLIDLWVALFLVQYSSVFFCPLSLFIRCSSDGMMLQAVSGKCLSF